MNERLSNILNSSATLPVVVGVASFAGGLGLGYFLWHQTIEVIKTEEVLDQVEASIIKYEDVASDYATVTEEVMIETTVTDEVVQYPEGKPDPSEITVDEELKHQLDELVDKYGIEDGHRIFRAEQHGFDDSETEQDPEPVITNVFTVSDEEWDFEKEQANRTDEAPYILHKDEFWAEEEGLPQLTLTYFAGDDIMVDQDEKPIYNHISVVGELRWGHGSQDQNVLYVRNPKLKVEYEILKDSGSYAIEVLGLDNSEEDEEIKVGKFKPED